MLLFFLFHFMNYFAHKTNTISQTENHGEFEKRVSRECALFDKDLQANTLKKKY